MRINSKKVRILTTFDIIQQVTSYKIRQLVPLEFAPLWATFWFHLMKLDGLCKRWGK